MNYAIFAFMAKQHEGLHPLNKLQMDELIKRQATQYARLADESQQWLAGAEDRLFSGSPGTVYLKKMGHRPLTKKDVDSLVNALGTAEQKQQVVDYSHAQRQLTERLKTTQNIGLVLSQAAVSYARYYQRESRPELWKPGEIIAITEVLERLKL